MRIWLRTRNLLSRQEELEEHIKGLKLIAENLKKALEMFPEEDKEDNGKKQELSQEALLELYKNRQNILSTLKEINNDHAKWNPLKVSKNLDDYQSETTWTQYNTEISKKLADLSMQEKYFDVLFQTNTKGFEKLKKVFEDYRDKLSSVVINDKKQVKLNNKILDFNKHILYTRAGFTGTSFMFDLDNDSTQIGDRFKKRDFQGTRYEIGYTYQLKSVNFFGINISKEYSDNSSTLTPTKYKFKTIDVTTNPNLEVSKELEALSGDYDKFDEFQLAIDYVRMVAMKAVYNKDEFENNTTLYLNINPYVRHKFYDNAATLNPDTSIGLGVYAFNVNENSIAGGVYVQANDLFNNNRENAVAFSKQLSVGLIFKYAINSFNPKGK